MNIHQIGRKLQVQINEFSGKLSPHFSKPIRRFVEQMLYGMLLSQDVKLSEIGRALEEKIKLKKTEDRLSVNLNAEGLAERLIKQIVKSGSRRVREDTLLIVDQSDIRKNYARRMEYLAKVRDGSSGEIWNGYWTLDVIACSAGSRKIVPLYKSLYSCESPEFDSENNEILRPMDLINEECKGRGIWVGDRGFDRKNLFHPMMDKKIRFIVRLVGDRDLVFRGRLQKTVKLAQSCPRWYRDVIVKEEKGEEKSYQLEYGFREVKLPEREEKLALVVIRGFGEQPMMLLTNLPLRKSRSCLWFIVDAYLTRWRIEEAIRFSKQSYNLEDVRVLTYRRLCNLIALVLAASYFTAVYLGDRLRIAVLTRRVLKAARRFYGIASFRYYAIADGIAYILRRIGKGPLYSMPLSKDDRQLLFLLNP